MNVKELGLELYEQLYTKVKESKATNAEANFLRQLTAFLQKEGYRKQVQTIRNDVKGSHTPTLDPKKGVRIEEFVKEEPVGRVDPLEAAKNYKGYSVDNKAELEEVVIEPEEAEEGNILATSEDKPKKTIRKKIQK